MKTKFKDLKVGDIASETQFYKVAKITKEEVVLKNDDGEEIEVNKEYAEEFLDTAEQVVETKTVTKTEATEAFIASSGVAVTVNFNKQVKEADVVKEIENTYLTTPPKDIHVKLVKSVKSALEGVERTMVGRHYGHKDDFGRIHFIDMQEDKGNKPDYDARHRLVDPRSLNWFIARGVKYVVK